MSVAIKISLSKKKAHHNIQQIVPLCVGRSIEVVPDATTSKGAIPKNREASIIGARLDMISIFNAISRHSTCDDYCFGFIRPHQKVNPDTIHDLPILFYLRTFLGKLLYAALMSLMRPSVTFMFL